MCKSRTDSLRISAPSPSERREFSAELPYNIRNSPESPVMPRCQFCGKKVKENAIFCPKCGEILVDERTEWQEFRIQAEAVEAKDRANMYLILAAVLASVGLIGGSLLFVSSSVLGFFGLGLVLLGVGCTAAAERHGQVARNLKRQLSL
jgi:predicted nucleic acid-binding Zn ribbon protein